MSAEPKIRHEWYVPVPVQPLSPADEPSRYQTDSEVVLSVFIRNVKEENLTVVILPTSVRASLLESNTR